MPAPRFDSTLVRDGSLAFQLHDRGTVAALTGIVVPSPFNMRLLAFLLLSCLSLSAATVEYNAVFASVDHSFSPSGALSIASSGGVAVEPRPMLTADFSQDKQLRLVYAAPTGKRFTIAPIPPGATAYQMSIDMPSHSVIANDDSTVGVSILFNGLTGIAPTPFGFGGTFDGTGRLSVGSLFNIVRPFSFESVQMLFDIPPAFNHTLNMQPFRLFFRATAFFPSNYTGGDPGSVLSVTDVPAAVPEPSTFVLIPGGVLAFAALRRQLS